MRARWVVLALALVACAGEPQAVTYAAEWHAQIGVLPHELTRLTTAELGPDYVCFASAFDDVCSGALMSDNVGNSSHTSLHVEGFAYGPDDLQSVPPFEVRFYPSGRIIGILYPRESASAGILRLGDL